MIGELQYVFSRKVIEQAVQEQSLAWRTGHAREPSPVGFPRPASGMPVQQGVGCALLRHGSKSQLTTERETLSVIAGLTAETGTWCGRVKLDLERYWPGSGTTRSARRDGVQGPQGHKRTKERPAPLARPRQRCWRASPHAPALSYGANDGSSSAGAAFNLEFKRGGRWREGIRVAPAGPAVRVQP